MIYQFGDGYRFRPEVDPQRVGEELEKLRQRRGGELTPEDVLTAARSTRSPLHPAFEWDDSRAAHQYRLDQASYLIRAVYAIPEEDEVQHERVRAFVYVKSLSTGEEHYTSTVVAMSDAELRAQVLQRALTELRTWQRKYRELKELAAVFEAIEEVANSRELVLA